ncbi:hypothetical protein ACHMXB_21495 (plasmid) [Arthrobacter sp. UC242_113]|uniref:hypothetical protein n=1 Tax=Arthrobacter sp. UC242_113 TaxID=3374550 RepID=UPI00375762D1
MSKSSPENPVAFTMGWGATVLGLFGGISLFLPGPFKDFMLAHPLWAWAGLMLLLIVYRQIVAWNLRSSEDRQSKLWGRKVTALSNHWSREEIRLAAEFKKKESELFRINREKDDSLLNERLESMKMNGGFHTYLAEGVDHRNLSYSFIVQLEEQLTKWRRDWREFFDPEVARAWERFTAAAAAYQSKVSEYMWTKDIGDNLHVPPEWKDSDHEQYRTAFQELEMCRTALYVALNELHRIQHAKGITAPLQASDTSATPAGMARNNLIDPPPVPKPM